MEIKTAFSSQFNHDAAIRGFWRATHVFLFFSLKIGQEESLRRATYQENKFGFCKCDLFINNKIKAIKITNNVELFVCFFVR